MAKIVSTSLLNASASYIQSNSKKMGIYTANPANLAACTATTYLAVVTMATDDFTIADGDVSGKKVTVAQKTTIAVATTGVPSAIALFSSAAGSSGLHFITTCSTAQALVSTANTITIPSWKIEFRDAT